jgi:hypothetical protein
MTTLRIKFEYDPDADLSHLEQWDTPEKYYGSTPNCESSACEGWDDCMTYKEGHQWRCEECGTEQEHDGSEMPNLGGVCLDPKDGRRIPFDEYMGYYGNPESHVVLCALVEKQCEHCDEWAVVDSLCGIDFMDNDDWATGTFNENDLSELGGYQLTEAKGMLDEARLVDEEARKEAAESA